MSIKFECPQCGQRISADAGPAESAGYCPTCANVVQVPLQIEDRQSAPAAWAASLVTVVNKRTRTVAFTILALGLFVVGGLLVTGNREPHLVSATQKALAAGSRLPEQTVPVDEDLFLIRKLETLYDTLFNAGRNDAHLREIQAEALQFSRRLEPDTTKRAIANLYADFLSAFGAVAEFQATTGRIENSTSESLESGRINNSLNTGFDSGRLWAQLEDAGFDTGAALGAAMLFGTASWLFQDAMQTSERENAQNEQSVEALTKYRNTVEPILVRARETAATIASQHAWKQGEWGFDETAEESAHVKTFIARNDVSALATLARNRMQLRPRDPFAIEFYVDYLLRFGNVSGDSVKLLELADLSHRGSSLVPADHVYDAERRRHLTVATWCAVQAAEGFAGQSFLNKDCDLTRLCVAYADLLARADPADPSGFARFLSAVALAHRGKSLEAQELLEAIHPLRKTNGELHYFKARLHAIRGEPDQAADSLRMAVSCGFERIREARKSKDFTRLSGRHREVLRESLRVKHTAQVNFGFFDDDIQMTNLSPFPLTNVSLKPVIKNGTSVYEPSLNPIARLEPGQSYTWVNCVSITGSRHDSADFPIVCDQQ